MGVHKSSRRSVSLKETTHCYRFLYDSMISTIRRKSCKRRQSKLGMSTIFQDLNRKSRTAEIQIFEILPPISCSCASMIADQSPLNVMRKKWSKSKYGSEKNCSLLGSLDLWLNRSKSFCWQLFFPAAQKVLQDSVNFDEEELSPAWCWLLLWSIKSIWTWKICCWFLGTLKRRTMRADSLWQLGNCSYHIAYWSILNKSGSRIKALNLQNV